MIMESQASISKRNEYLEDQLQRVSNENRELARERNNLQHELEKLQKCTRTVISGQCNSFTAGLSVTFATLIVGIREAVHGHWEYIFLSLLLMTIYKGFFDILGTFKASALHVQDTEDAYHKIKTETSHFVAMIGLMFGLTYLYRTMTVAGASTFFSMTITGALLVFFIVILLKINVFFNERYRFRSRL